MKFMVVSAKHRFEFTGSIEELVEDLQEDEIPCVVTNRFTTQSFKLTRKMLFGIKKNGESFMRRLPGLRKCSFE